MSKELPFRTRSAAAIGALLAGTRLGNAYEAFLNRYEAAQPGSPRRSWIPAFTRDARYDANAFSRWEMVRKIRYHERNCWLVQKMREQFVKYVVGPYGLQVTPASANKDWNKAMLDSYLQWCESPCLDSRMSMAGVHKLEAGEFHIDGEVFVLKTREKVPGKQSIPKIQLIESHRCSTPGTEFSTDYGKDWIDGVKVDSDTGKPLAYSLRDGLMGDEWHPIPADNVIHIFEPERIGMWRGITPYHSVLNTITDLDDLEIMEMEKAKESKRVAIINQTWNGEADPNRARRERFLGAAGIPLNGNEVPDKALQERIEQYEMALSSRAIYLRPGEKMEQFKTDQPSAAEQWYYRYKIGQVCNALGIPMLLVMPESLQGTVSRAVLDDANLFFKSKWQLFAHSAREKYLYYANWARYNVKSLVDAPADWNACHVAQPRAVNVDVGRNSAAMLAELAAGTRSYDDIAAADGTNAETVMRKKARNIQMIHELAEEFKIQPAELAAPLAGILQQLAMANQANAQADAANNPEEEKEPALTE